MTKQDVFRILEMEETKDENAIKAAYRKKVVTVNPEDDAEGFKLLREAFDEAIRLSKEDETQETAESELTDIERHIKSAEKIYNDVTTRQNVELWVNWLSHPLCQNLDTANDMREAFLAFALEHFYFTHEVWATLDKEFQIVSEQESLRELFPENFIGFIVFHIENEDFVEYDEMMTREEKDEAFSLAGVEDIPYASVESVDYVPNDQYLCEDDGYFAQVSNFTIAMERLLGIPKEEEAYGEMAKEIAGKFCFMEQQRLWHPYEYVEKMRYLYYVKSETQMALNMAVNILKREIFPKFSCYGVASATEILIDNKVQNKDAELDFDMIEEKVNEVLTERPQFTAARLALARLTCLRGEYDDAKEKVMAVLEEHSQNEKAITLMREINDFLIQSFVDKIQAEPENMKHRIELGWCLFQCERGDDVLQVLDTVKSDDDVDYDYVNLKGRCLFNMKRYEESLPLLIKWKKKIETIIAENEGKSDDEVSDDARKRRKRLGFCLYLVGICYKELGMYEDAETTLKLSLEKELVEEEAFYYQEALGIVYMDKKNYGAAVDIWDAMVDKADDYLPAYVHRQVCYFELRNGQGVVDDYYRIIGIFPQYVPAYVYAAKVFNIYGQFDSFYEVLKQAKEMNIVSNALLMEEAVCLKKNGKMEEAIQLFKQAEEKLKDDNNDIEDIEEFYIEEAITYIAATEYATAKSIINNVLQESPENRRANWILIDAVERMGENPCSLYESMKKQFPEDAEVNYELGRYYLNNDCFKDAEVEFGKAIEKNPKHFGAYNQLMHVWLRRYRMAEVKDYYVNAVDMATKQLENDDDSYYLVERGLLYIDGYEFDKAVADFKLAIEMEPGNQYAINGCGVALLLKGDLEEAEEMLRHGLSILEDPEFTNLHFNLAKCLQKAGKYQEAEACYQELVKDFGDTMERRRILASIYNQMGDYQSAWKQLEYCMEREERDIAAGDEHAKYDIIYPLIKQIETAVLADDKPKVKVMTEGLIERVKKLGLLKLIISKGKDSMASNLYKSEILCEVGGFFLYVARDYKQAITYYKAATKYLPPIKDIPLEDKENVGTLYMELALAYLYQRNSANAKINANKATQAYLYDWQNATTYVEYPRETPLRYKRLAMIALCQGLVKDAVALIQETSNFPQCIHCRYSECYEKYLCLGRITELAGNYRKACEYFEKAFELAPDDAECKVALEALKKKI